MMCSFCRYEPPVRTFPDPACLKPTRCVTPARSTCSSGHNVHASPRAVAAHNMPVLYTVCCSSRSRLRTTGSTCVSATRGCMRTRRASLCSRGTRLRSVRARRGLVPDVRAARPQLRRRVQRGIARGTHMQADRISVHRFHSPHCETDQVRGYSLSMNRRFIQLWTVCRPSLHKPGFHFSTYDGSSRLPDSAGGDSSLFSSFPHSTHPLAVRAPRTNTR